MGRLPAAGTVLVESPVPGVGSDLVGVAAARVNAHHRHDIVWLTADARRLPYPDASVDGLRCPGSAHWRDIRSACSAGTR
jgi:hypothetical protein